MADVPLTASDKVDAFILYNEREGPIIEQIVEGLDRRGITTHFWRRDIPPGENWQEYEERRLASARNILVFLGNEGWGPTHLNLTRQVIASSRRTIPILIGDSVRESDFEHAGALFQKRRYLDLHTITDALLDLLAATIRDSAPASVSAPDAVPPIATFDSVIQTLVDGNESQRADLLQQLMRDSRVDRRQLAARLRIEIAGPFRPTVEFSESSRDPSLIPSIRSWMMSCLIWTEPLDPESEALILKHLNHQFEPAENVRFWILAGLNQRQVPYLSTAVAIASDDPAPEVRALGRALAAPINPQLLSEFRQDLTSGVFERAWPVLRVLRVAPIEDLASDVWATLMNAPASSPLAYDALYALTNSRMTAVAAPIFSRTGESEALVERVLQEARLSNANAIRNFARLLVALDTQVVDRLLTAAQQTPYAAVALRVSNQLQELRQEVSGPRVVLPGFASDGIEPQEDDLNIQEDVQTLVAVMLAKSVTPPLAVGLFGDWGTGKSHFMTSMRSASVDVTARARLSHDSVFCSDVVSIVFNAWHYVDTNLWASLVSFILQQLAAHVTPGLTPEEQEHQLLSELGSAQAVVLEATVEKRQTEKALTERQKELQTLSSERRNKELELNELRVSDLRQILESDSKLKGQIETALQGLGVPAMMSAVADLAGVLSEANSLRGRASALFVGLLNQRTVLLVTAAAFLIIPLGNWGIQAVTHSGGFGPLVTVSAQAVALLTGFVGLLRKSLAYANGKLVSLEDAKQQVDQLVAAKRAQPTTKEMELQSAIADLTAQEVAVAKRLEAAAKRVLDLEERIRSVQEGRSLARFLADRTRSEDYRRHLGLISTIRQDLDALATRLTAASTREPLDGQQRVDRIVLYIDDLDRCPAGKVVDVLQAVHLLLAYPLFVVVVGVDPRWLLRSLGSNYSALQSIEPNDASDGWRTTPQNYLEKIFQIPFTLRPMTHKGYNAMMRRLFSGGRPLAGVADGRSAHTSSSGATGRENTTSVPMDGLSQDERERTHDSDTTPAPTPSVSRPLVIDSQEKKFEVNEQALKVQEWEVAFAEQLFPLIQTPRAAKRFTNLYRLLKAPLPTGKLATFEGTAELPGEFRLPMLLLAVVVGAAADAVILFPALQLAAVDREDVLSRIRNAEFPGADSIKRLLDRLGTILDRVAVPGDPALFLEWLPRVSRFSYDLAGIVLPLHDVQQ